MILVVDHYDSFTYNLVQLIEGLGRATEVVKSDEAPAGELVAREPEAVVLSPGPGHPRDAGCFPELLAPVARGRRPSWACASGTRRSASRAAGRSTARRRSTGRPRSSTTRAAGSSRASPIPFEAGRYHSLVVIRDDLPAELELTAWTEDGLVMATQHRELPRFGVQFHPGVDPHARGPADRRELPGARRLIREPGSRGRRRTPRS